MSKHVRELNEALIREVLTFIQIHPERWDQRHYLRVGECGAIGCFAGWAAVLYHNLSLEQVDGPGVGVMFNRRKISIASMLGLTDNQFKEIYGYTTVLYIVGDAVLARRPTFAELCDKVEQVTGIKFKQDVPL